MDSGGLIAALGGVNLASLIAILTIGLPHGAMDGAVALALGYGDNGRRMAGFVLGYIALAALVVAFWLAFPVLALMAFLLISLVHFGNGDTEADQRLIRLVQIICHGGIVMVAIPLLHPVMTAAIFAQLSGPDIAPVFTCIRVLAAAMAGAGMIYGFAAFRDPGLRGPFLEWAGLLLLVWILPPLAGFAIYFAGVHTPRHIRRIFREIRRHRPALSPFRLTAVFTLITWAGAAAAYAFLAGRMTPDEAAFRVIFIGLAALTVPHMILIDGIFRPRMLAEEKG